MRLPDGWIFRPVQDKRNRLQINIEKTELVRCGNCQYWAPYDNDFDDESCYGVCSQLNRMTYYDWYCADGVRKQNGTPE